MMRPGLALAKEDIQTDGVIHHWCCDSTRALCGTPISDAFIDEVAQLTPNDCVMCVDVIMADLPCSSACDDLYGNPTTNPKDNT